jgi:hypothetical protein
LSDHNSDSEKAADAVFSDRDQRYDVGSDDDDHFLDEAAQVCDGEGIFRRD